MTEPESLADVYFEAWALHDAEQLRSALADNVTFDGPLASVRGAEDYVSSIAGLFQATRSVAIEKRWVDGPDVLTWFQLTVGDAQPTSVASWIHTANGRIAAVRVVFDPRGML